MVASRHNRECAAAQRLSDDVMSILFESDPTRRNHAKGSIATLQLSQQKQTNQHKERQAEFRLIANLLWRKVFLSCVTRSRRRLGRSNGSGGCTARTCARIARQV
jgi:hypothetical protein